jgi:hypothetical protein
MIPSTSPVRLRADTHLALAFLALSCGTAALTGCSIFSQSVDPELRDHLRAAARPGTPIDEAEAAISSQGFRCSMAHGQFYDEYDKSHDVPQYLWCVERPGTFSFACQNRTQVFIIPHEGFVDQTYVVRSTTCNTQ